MPRDALIGPGGGRLVPPNGRDLHETHMNPRPAQRDRWLLFWDNTRPGFPAESVCSSRAHITFLPKRRSLDSKTKDVAERRDRSPPTIPLINKNLLVLPLRRTAPLLPACRVVIYKKQKGQGLGRADGAGDWSLEEAGSEVLGARRRQASGPSTLCIAALAAHGAGPPHRKVVGILAETLRKAPRPPQSDVTIATPGSQRRGQ